MVTVAQTLEALYPVDTTRPIELEGYISGNYGRFNRDWFKCADGDEAPGHGVIHAAGDNGEDTVNLWSQGALDGLGFLGWDETQLATQATVYASGDLAPCYGFAENPGAIFQGHCADTNGNLNAKAPLDAGNAGTFETSVYDVKVYAFTLVYIADTAAAAQRIVMRVAPGGQGG